MKLMYFCNILCYKKIFLIVRCIAVCIDSIFEDFYFIFSSDELSAIESDEIITRLEGIYKKFAPMYKFLRDVSDDYFKTHQ